MNDTYIELLVKAPYKKTAVYLHNIMMFAGIVFVIGAFFITPLCLILGIIILACSGIPSHYDGVEFEYLYMDKELQIDKIYHQEKRKTAAEFKLSDMELMAPKGSDRLALYPANIRTYDFSSQTEEGCPYELIFQSSAGNYRVVIDTTEELVDAIRNAFPRNAFKK